MKKTGKVLCTLRCHCLSDNTAPLNITLGQQPKQRSLRPPSPLGTSSSLSRGTRNRSQARVSEALPRGLLLMGRSETPHRGSIPFRSQKYLFSMWTSSGSTLSSSWMVKLLILSLKEKPATLRRKLISTACICDLFFQSLPKAVPLCLSVPVAASGD